MRSVLLYTKDGCGLCDIVKEELAKLQEDYPHQLQEIDISLDQGLFEKYKHKIPILHIGETWLYAPISRQDLVNALAA